MQLSYSARLVILTTILILFPAAGNASHLLQVHDFQESTGFPGPAGTNFSIHLRNALTEEGLDCANGTDQTDSRYSISGLVKSSPEGTSFSAMITDSFHLEPEVFMKGKQIGGKTSLPAAIQLAKSVQKLLANQTISSVEVSGSATLPPSSIMGISQIFPGQVITPQKIVAARINLENSGLFDLVRLYLTPTEAGRKLKIYVEEGLMAPSVAMPGPGLKVLKNILGPSENELPQFPALPFPVEDRLLQGNSTENLVYAASKIIEEQEAQSQPPSPEQYTRLIAVTSSIRDWMHSQKISCYEMCIIMTKLCSLLDSKTVRNITDSLQRDIELNDDNSSFEKTIELIDFLSSAQAAAYESQTILAARVFEETPHSPVIPWVLHSLGEQALKAEDINRSAPLLAAAISVGSLPVPPARILTAAKAQFSNLDSAAGISAGKALVPLLDNTDIPWDLRNGINELPVWASLCQTASSFSETDSLEEQLKEGNALILLDRPDLAEPLFHELHGKYPKDARPFTGFARLAFQRTGLLSSGRPYLERAARLSNKDNLFYELALAYNLNRLTLEALPTIKLEGRNSEEASATRFMLPKVRDFAKEYEQFNKPQAMLLQRGINVLDSWLAYPAMSNEQALESMFRQTSVLRESLPESGEIIAANYYFSLFASDREIARELLTSPLKDGVGPKEHFMQMNMLLKEMAENPSEEIASALEQAAEAAFSDEKSRSRIVSLQADALATLGFYRNSTQQLDRAASLYGLAVNISEGKVAARLLNNQACLNLVLGNTAEADDIYDEALDLDGKTEDVIYLGKAITSLSGEDRTRAISELIKKTEDFGFKKGVREAVEECPAAEFYVNNASQPGQKVFIPTMPIMLLKDESGMEADYDNYNGLQLNFRYHSNLWVLPPKHFWNGTTAKH